MRKDTWTTVNSGGVQLSGQLCISINAKTMVINHVFRMKSGTNYVEYSNTLVDSFSGCRVKILNDRKTSRKLLIVFAISASPNFFVYRPKK